MGIKDIFSEELADLLGIFPQYLYVSRIVQRAEIEVDEEGTVASALAGLLRKFRLKAISKLITF